MCYKHALAIILTRKIDDHFVETACLALGGGLECYVPITEGREAAFLIFAALRGERYLLPHHNIIQSKCFQEGIRIYSCIPSIWRRMLRKWYSMLAPMQSVLNTSEGSRGF